MAGNKKSMSSRQVKKKYRRLTAAVARNLAKDKSYGGSDYKTRSAAAAQIISNYKDRKERAAAGDKTSKKVSNHYKKFTIKPAIKNRKRSGQDNAVTGKRGPHNGKPGGHCGYGK